MAMAMPMRMSMIMAFVLTVSRLLVGATLLITVLLHRTIMIVMLGMRRGGIERMRKLRPYVHLPGPVIGVTPTLAFQMECRRR